MYIFIDPGQNTGWCEFDDEGNETRFGTTRNFEEFCEWVTFNIYPTIDSKIKNVVVEDFKLYASKAQAQLWSQFETVQVIGAVRFRCYSLQIPFEVVPARNKDIGFMYMGIKEPPHSNPLNHQMVAQAHGIFWLQNKGIRKPARR